MYTRLKTHDNAQCALAQVLTAEKVHVSLHHTDIRMVQVVDVCRKREDMRCSDKHADSLMASAVPYEGIQRMDIGKFRVDGIRLLKE
eukprot:6479550-Amphidinium_carterae.2